ncbi:MAG: RNA-binding domain-containing protein [Nitrosopumilus sp.]
MINKIEITIDIIIHATEDISKIFKAFEEVLDLKEEEFSIQETTGYFDNPITMLNVKMVKKQSQKFVKKLLESLSINQINELIEEIEERTVDSRFHMRLGKQELIRGDLVIREKDTIKIKIHTPIYNKKETVRIFSEIFQIVN